jgi:hypothetical protein
VVAAGLAGVLMNWRRRGGPGALPWAVAAAGIVAPVALHEFHYRYTVPVIPVACLAAGLAFAHVRARQHQRVGAPGRGDPGGQAGRGELAWPEAPPGLSTPGTVPASGPAGDAAPVCGPPSRPLPASGPAGHRVSASGPAGHPPSALGQATAAGPAGVRHG